MHLEFYFNAYILSERWGSWGSEKKRPHSFSGYLWEGGGEEPQFFQAVMPDNFLCSIFRKNIWHGRGSHLIIIVKAFAPSIVSPSNHIKNKARDLLW